MAQFSYSPFVTACAAPLSPHAGTAFGADISLHLTFQRRHRLRGSCRRKPTEGEHLAALARFELFPSRLLITFAATNAGWNMVVLLRCRLQYSLFRPILPSLHRPLGALGSNPPFHCGAFWCSTNTAYRAVPLRGAIVSMGLRGSPGGLRGEIEIFPGPLAKKFTLPPVAAALSALCQDSAPRTRAFPR